MQHYGDITKINGADVPPVNVIIGGSPCQDLSVAGKRAGLAGERSGLFMEQLRIIKEMRYADEFIRGRNGSNIRPRFMVWENVPGAFSSNKGEDFGAVLQETFRVVYEETPVIPIPKNGWPLAGCLQLSLSLLGRQCSIAWRVLDAQFWGVPQRRRRIALVADFGGTTAGEILFEREGVSGYSPESREAWKATPAYAETSVIRNDSLLGSEGVGNPPLTLKVRCGTHGSGGRGALIQTDQSATLSTFQDQTLFQPCEGNVVCMATQQGGAEIRTDDKAPTLTAAAGMSGNNQPVIAMGTDMYNGKLTGDKAASITTATGQGPANTGPGVIQQTYCIQGNCIDRADTAGCNGKGWTEDVAYTLNTIDRPAVAVGIPSSKANMVIAIENHPQDSRVKLSEDNVIQTLSGYMGMGGGNAPMVLECFSQDAYDKYTENEVAATIKSVGGCYGGIGSVDSTTERSNRK